MSFFRVSTAAEDSAYDCTKPGRLQCNIFDLMSNSIDLKNNRYEKGLIG